MVQKPKCLLGSEMIFEIATALQELLDNVPGIAEALTLEEERAAQLATTQQAKQEASTDALEEEATGTEDKPEAANTEEDQALSIMVEQAKTRLEKRRAKSSNKPDAAEIEANGGLQFDHTITVKDAEGSPANFEVIHHRVRYRQGPVTKVSKVYIWGSSKDLEPSLVLKECRFPSRGKEDLLKEQIFDLEQRLDTVVRLPANINIIKPLSFTIKRSASDDPDVGHWDVAILMELTPKGSMQDLLETVLVINLDNFRAWALQLLEGLMFYHRHGIVHAGIHPGNMLLIKADTGNTVVKLADASYQHAMHVFKHGLDAGYSAAASTNWICPEVMNGQEGKPIAASDIWDLGTSLLQMLFGLKVHSLHPSPRDLIDDLELSQSLEQLLDQIFKPDHRRRPSAFELLPSAFFRNNDPILAQPPSAQPSHGETVLRRTSSDVPRWRRESTTTPSASRYKNDFVEAGRLGRGGYGEVVRARNKLDGRFYAIKLIKSHSASALNDVLSEIMLLSQLNHPNVVRYFNAWLENEYSVADGQAQSQSSKTSSDGGDEDDDIFEDSSPSGLDFMSGSGPNIVFESDSDDEAPKPRITSDSDISVNREIESEYDVTTGDEPSADDDTEVDDEGRASCLDTRLRRKRSVSNIQCSKSTLYIQMEYCERKVCLPDPSLDLY